MKIVKVRDITTIAHKRICFDLQTYHLLERKFKEPVVQRLYRHHLILAFCEAVESQLGTEKVVFVDTTEYDMDSLCIIHGEGNVNKLVQNILSKLEKMLPIRICKIGIGIVDHLDASVIYDMCCAQLKKKDPSKYTFEKIKAYCEKHGLKFLTDKYFTKVKTKLALLS